MEVMGRLRPDMNYFTQFQKNLGENKGFMGIVIQLVSGIVATILILMAFVVPFLNLLDSSRFDGPLTDAMIMSALESTSFDPLKYSIVFSLVVIVLLFFICVGTQHAMVLAAKGELKGRSLTKVIIEGAKRYSLRFVGFAFAYVFIALIVSVLFGMMTMVISTDLDNVTEGVLLVVLTYLILLPIPLFYALTFEEGPVVVVKMFIAKHPAMFWGLPLLLGGLALIPLVSIFLNVLTIFLPLYYMTVFVEDMKESNTATDELKTND